MKYFGVKKHVFLVLVFLSTLGIFWASVGQGQHQQRDKRFDSQLDTIISSPPTKDDCLACRLYKDPRPSDDGPFGAGNLLTPAEEIKYAAINKIVCKTLSGATVQASAPLVENQLSVLTSAHLFYNEYSFDHEIEPNDCVYLIYDGHGQVVERVPIARIYSRWHENNKYHDANTDIAVVKLMYAPKTHLEPMKLSVGAKSNLFELVAFRNDMANDNRRVKSSGKFFDKAETGDEFNAFIMIHNASSSSGSSGAPLIDPQSGEIVAIDQGSARSRSYGVQTQIFDRKYNYNRAVAFDTQLIQQIHELISTESVDVVNAKPRTSRCLERDLWKCLGEIIVTRIAINIIQLAMYGFGAIALVLKVVKHIKHVR